MKKQVVVMLAAMLGVCCLAGCGNNTTQQEVSNETVQTESTEVATEETKVTEAMTEEAATQETIEVETTAEKAILAVSFGTSFDDSRDVTIGAIETALAESFSDYEVRRAFTSQIIIDVLKERNGLEIDNVTQALDRAVADGVKELVVQPTHLMNGFEYQDLAEELTAYVDQFEKIIFAEPLLMTDADFEAVVKAITEKTASYDDGATAICFMGHGTEADSNYVYAKLQQILTDGGYENYYVGTVEAAPTLDDVEAALEAKGTYQKVVLLPLMVVAGDHANNDMAGAEEDSWKSVLESAGYEVECVIEGLGQIPAVQDIYVAHAKAAMEADVAFEGVAQTESTEGNATLENGTYDIQVESSSSMFKVVKAQLTVEDEQMTAVITLSGTGYTKLYMGTAQEAATAEEKDCIAFVEDEEGAYTYTIPVTAINQPIACAAFSAKKEEWYDRELIFLSVTQTVGEAETTLEQATAVQEAVTEGTYSIDVTLDGGSGKTTVVSPATLKVEGDTMVATIEWTSPNYDYMLVNGEKYLPINTEGNSVFEIPVAALDTALDVIGDTVAMSKPHEVEYTITFHSATMKSAE